MYLKFRVLKSLVFSTHFSAIKAELKAKGLKDPANMHRIYKYGTPWITQTLQHNHWPMGVIPPNLTLAGPINLAGVDLDPVKASGLLAWTRNAPTVLISFGTIYNFTQEQTRIMLDVIEHTLERIDVQVLWKLDTVDEPYNKFLQQATMRWPGRLRIEKWLDAEPASLLQSGHVKAFVHHGGASSFHDALAYEPIRTLFYIPRHC